MIVASRQRIALLRWTLLVIAAGCVAWAVFVAISGGVLLHTSWGRISSRNPVRPFLLGGLALMVYVAAFRHHAAEDVRRLSLVRRPALLAALLAAATLGIGIRWGTFVASGSDASGYISQAEMWLRGELTTLAPEWAHDAPWDGAAWSSAPLGYRPSEISYVLVPTYSPGLPMAMALFQAIGGRDAVYYVVPIFGALAVWVTYLLGTRFAGPWAGLIAALLMLSSPAFLLMLVQPFSDVPVAALWGVALWAASREGPARALAAGAAAALAILIRPNLAPLAAVVALIVAWKPSWRIRDLLVFATPIVPAAAAVGLLNAHLHGSPLRSGYGRLEILYAAERIWPNLRHYLSWIVETQTPLILLALAAPFVVRRTPADARGLLLTGVVFPVAVLSLYLPYFVFEEWWYLRFLLPAYPPLLAATAAVIVTGLRRARRPVLAIAVATLIVAAVALHGLHYSGAFTVEDGEQRYTRVADYVKQLPTDAVFVTVLHSGSIRYYTGRDILRWELVDPLSLDTAVAYLRERGHDVYLIADDGDVNDFKRRFANTRAVHELDHAVPVDLGGVRIYAVAGSRPLPSPLGV